MEIRKLDHWATKLLFLGIAVCCLSKCKKDEAEDEAPASVLTSDIMLWTSTYLNFNSPITVICNGETKQITTYQYNTIPACGSAGCATFDLGPGTYPVYAYHDTITWIDTVMVGENECIRLNIDSLPATVNNDNATIMAGTYSGIGQFLPGQIVLGVSPNCIEVPYDSHLRLGYAFLQIDVVSANTINIVCTSDSFPTITFPDVPIERNDNMITFTGGDYNVQTHHMHYSGGTPNSTWMTTDACLIQLPYVFGWNPDGTGFTYNSIDHLIYTGEKDN